jgi:hypothetical protein
VETSWTRQYAPSMLLATSHPHKMLDLTGTDTVHGHVVYAFPIWAAVLVYVAILSLLFTGVWVMAGAARRMSRPGRIVTGLIAVYVLFGAFVAFVDAYRPTGDWRGGIFEGSFIVLYGLVAAGLVWAVDKAAKRLRAHSLA